MADTEPKFRSKTSFIQLFYGVWVNLATMCIGLSFGFPAIQIPQLLDIDSDIDVTTEEASWIVSVVMLFCPVGTLLSGLMMDKFGRSTMIIGCQIPMFIGWMYTGIAKRPIHIIIGRAITGVGCGLAMGPPRLYTTEISLPKMRGVLGAFPNIFVALGITVVAGLGALFEWHMICYIICGLNFLLFASYLLLEETPHFLLLKENVKCASQALTSFRAKDYNVKREMNELIEFKQNNNLCRLTFMQRKKLLFSKSTCIPFATLITYILILNLSGAPVVTFWTIEILWLANASGDYNTSNILIAVTRLTFCIIASILLFRVGRRPMALVSSFGVSAACLAFGMILYTYDDPGYMPQICLIVYTAFAGLGYYILPFLMMGEIYRLQVRGTLVGISVAIASLLVFASTKCFHYLTDGIGLANTMIFFGICALLGALFLYLFLPETKHLTLQEIEEFYAETKPPPESYGPRGTASKSALSTMHDTIVKSRTIRPPSRGGDDLHQRSFVEVSASTTSLTSAGKRRSVTLVVGGKQFKSLTPSETQEMTIMDEKQKNHGQSELFEEHVGSDSKQSTVSKKKEGDTKQVKEKDKTGGSTTTEAATTNDVASTSKDTKKPNKEDDSKEPK